MFVILSETKNLNASTCAFQILRDAQDDNDCYFNPLAL